MKKKLYIIIMIAILTGCTTPFSYASFPRYRVCIVEDEERCAIIDEQGVVQVPFEPKNTRYLSKFQEGRAVFKDEKGQEGWFDEAGNVAVSPRFLDLCLPSEGLACAYTETGCGYVDLNGEEVIPAKWDLCGSFSEGRATVITITNGERLETIIDIDGEAVSEFVFNKSYSFSDERGLVRLSPTTPAIFHQELGSKFGFIDLTGSPITKFEFDKAYPFENGIALVGQRTGEHLEEDEFGCGIEDIFEYGYLDTEGVFIWEMEFQDATPFNKSGFAKVDTCDLDECYSGVVQKNGTWLFEPQAFSYVARPSEGLAFVEMIDGWRGYVDLDGNKVFEARYGGEFVNGIAEVDNFGDPCGGSVYVDKEGRSIFPFSVSNTTSSVFDEHQVLLVKILTPNSKYKELLLHRERGVIWPPGWNEPGAGEGVLCWPKQEQAKEATRTPN